MLSDLQNNLKFHTNTQNSITNMYKELKKQIDKLYGSINKEINYIISFIIIALYYFLVVKQIVPNNFKEDYIFSIGYTLIIMAISMVLKNTKINSIKGIFEFLLLIFTVFILFIGLLIESLNPLLALIIYLNPLLFSLIVYLLNVNFYNEKQETLMEKIEGNKRFIREFTRLKHWPIDYINFVKYYYVLAETYDIKITENSIWKFRWTFNKIK